MLSVWPQLWQAVGGPRDKMRDMVANSKSGDYNLFTSG